MTLFSYPPSVSARRGQAIFLAAILFLVVSFTLSLGVVVPVRNELLSSRAALRGSESFFAGEGATQDVAYRVINALPVDAVETLSFQGIVATATTTATGGGRDITSAANRESFVRTSRLSLKSGDGASFYYGVQAGAGGIILENSSSVVGNLYANGPIDGSGSNLIKGNAISAGSSGLVDGVHATSSVYAHSVQNAEVDGDAYYQTISGTTVHGASHPGSADQATSSLPISDSQIAEWESDAAAGGTVSSPCPYTISANTTLGPKKIACDLAISGSPTVTLLGPVWVSGKITIQNSAILKVDASLGSKSVALIADNPSNQVTSSTITIQNSVSFQDSGTAGSYILLLAQNRSAEQGGDKKAIEIKNSVSGKFLAYAGHGEILVQNSVSLKEVTAYRLRLQNSAQVVYETGLANLLFTAGPSGGYELGKWQEVE